MIDPPRQPPKAAPDSLPKREQRTDVLPDDARRGERPRTPPPDSPPRRDDERSIEGSR